VASIQARHTRACDSGKPWTTFDDATRDCTCEPTYYVVVREGGKLIRERVGKNRRAATRARDRIAVKVDEGDYQRPRTIRFAEFADTWLASLERKATTVASYRSTVAYAKVVLGGKVVRRISVADVAAFNEHLRGHKLSASSRAKHLRVLSACFASAVEHGYIARNPVKSLPRSERPRAAKREAAYFESAELPGLLAALPEGVYRAITEVALKSGARQGELIALRWGDVDLVQAVIRIRRTRTDGHLHEPKSHEQRDVDITPDVVELLGRLWGDLGQPGDETIVFPGATRDGYLDASTLRRELYRAMRAAGVDRVGPTGAARTFHSLRHTYAKRALELGQPISWLSRHLGHSSITVTDGVYGHFERAERKRHAAAMAGAFA
jgi:integrase